MLDFSRKIKPVSKEGRFAIKEAVLNSDIDKEVAKASYQNFAFGDSSCLEGLVKAYGYDVVKVALSLNQASYKRKERVSNRIGKYISAGQTHFITLTFTDEFLNRTSAKTRRVMVSRFLRSCCSGYVANIDFGVDERYSKREHYHAVCVFNGFCPYGVWKDKNGRQIGFIKEKKIRASKSDLERTCKYVSKLSNHAMKVNGGKCPRMIYSRKTFN